MSTRDPANPPNPDRSEHGRPGDCVDLGERDRLGHALSERFAPHVQAAAAAVRQAEQDLEDAREELSRVRQAEADRPYRSDRLVFVRGPSRTRLRR